MIDALVLIGILVLAVPALCVGALWLLFPFQADPEDWP